MVEVVISTTFGKSWPVQSYETNADVNFLFNVELVKNVDSLNIFLKVFNKNILPRLSDQLNKWLTAKYALYEFQAFHFYSKVMNEQLTF